MPGEGPQPKTPRRRWGWRGWLFVLAGLATVTWLIFRDETLKPVDDLMPRRPEIAWDDNNGWKRLEDFALGLPAMDNKRRRQLSDFLNEQAPLKSKLQRKRSDSKENETPPLPAGAWGFCLDVSQLPALEAIVAVPLFQSQQWKDLSEPAPRGVAALDDLRVRLHLTVLAAIEDNNRPLALRLWTLCSALQTKMTTGATSGYVLSVAMSFTDPAMVARSLAFVDWNDAELKQLAAALSGEPVAVDDAREAAYHDFQRFYNYMVNTGPAIPGIAGLEEPGFPREILYQKHRTANHYAEQMRVWRDFVDVSTTEERQQRMEECVSSFPRWLDPNFYGTSLLRGFRGRSYHNWQAGRRSIQVLIALHRCLKARGSLPDRLDELVPEFLPEVPRDRCRSDSAPLRWDPKHRAVRNNGDAATLPWDRPTRTKLISEDYRTFLFRTKAEEDARRATAPPPPAIRTKGTPGRE